MRNTKALLPIIVIHSCMVFIISVALFITKWFPYGSYTVRLREWLYRFF